MKLVDNLSRHKISQVFKIWPEWTIYFGVTRGIWKVRSMVQYFSNRLTNPFVFGTILISNLCSMLGNKPGMEGM